MNTCVRLSWKYTEKTYLFLKYAPNWLIIPKNFPLQKKMDIMQDNKQFARNILLSFINFIICLFIKMLLTLMREFILNFKRNLLNSAHYATLFP